jgi:hypothetical protein
MPARKSDSFGIDPIHEKKFTLLWIPRSGLFYDGGKFMDGTGNEIEWNRTIPLFPSMYAAEIAKAGVLEKHPDARGEVVILGVTVRE